MRSVCRTRSANIPVLTSRRAGRPSKRRKLAKKAPGLSPGSCEVFFRYRTMVVFQIQLTKHLDILPLTRDYIYRSHN